MSKILVIVESPTKARTLSRFLGSEYKIEASMGHVRDLPKSKLGVDIDADFEPQYVIPKDKRKIVENLKHIAKDVDEIILATDSDREGEAIAWHVEQLTSDKSKKKFKRIIFHEITKDALLAAMKNPREIDLKRVNAQVARRVLDRLVGYKLSPILWFKVKKGLSAGRVQSVTVRLIVEREREIQQFKPVEYWSLEALLKKHGGAEKEQFESSLTKKDDKRIEITKEKESKVVVKDLEAKDTKWKVEKNEQKDVKKHPSPPFTTSTMTQAASNTFGYTAKKTMKLAQDLYEEGLITYHRTDSVNLAPIALSTSRKFIEKEFGKNYLPEKSRVFKTKSKLAQEAHEAIRSTKVDLKSDKIKINSKDHKKLYDLIWKRFVASQMAEAIYDQIALDISASKYTFRAAGSIIKFPGYLKVFGRNEGDVTGNEENKVPPLPKGTDLDLVKLIPTQHFTEPPPKYTEASLIKALEERGIGRPSTYAPIISTILDRNYVEREDRKFRPTPLGVATNDFLVTNFPDELDYNFTAEMEDGLDDIAKGKKEWVPTIREFYTPFAEHLKKVEKEAKRVKIFAELTDEKCPDGHPLVIRYGRFGKFLACEKFPEHKFTKSFEEKIDAKCPESGDDVITRRSKRGRLFYGCSGYPKCKWMSWTNPLKEKEDAEKPQETTAE